MNDPVAENQKPEMSTEDLAGYLKYGSKYKISAENTSKSAGKHFRLLRNIEDVHGVILRGFYYCTGCKGVIKHNAKNGTAPLMRHVNICDSKGDDEMKDDSGEHDFDETKEAVADGTPEICTVDASCQNVEDDKKSANVHDDSAKSDDSQNHDTVNAAGSGGTSDRTLKRHHDDDQFVGNADKPANLHGEADARNSHEPEHLEETKNATASGETNDPALKRRKITQNDEKPASENQHEFTLSIDEMANAFASVSHIFHMYGTISSAEVKKMLPNGAWNQEEFIESLETKMKKTMPKIILTAVADDHGQSSGSKMHLRSRKNK